MGANETAGTNVRLAGIHLRFYAELNDFVPPAARGATLAWRVDRRSSVKHVIEARGVPHTEVDLILVNGAPVDFDYLVRDGDRISVYPVFESLDIRAVTPLRAQPLREVRFVLDAHLGKLAVYLRMLGFDTLYRRDYGDDELAAIAAHAGRILLTKDRGLLKRKVVTHGYCVRATDRRVQTEEVLRRFDLFGCVRPFKRCMRCNGQLGPVDKETILPRLLPKTRQYYDTFHRCEACDRIYWRGSHYAHMQQFIDALPR